VTVWELWRGREGGDEDHPSSLPPPSSWLPPPSSSPP
jgi:hypothetical protein